MARKKYQFLPVETIYRGAKAIQAQRIQALIDIPHHNVKQGDIGGYISCFGFNGKNLRLLSDKGHCWISDDAIVQGYIKVGDNAIIKGDAHIYSEEFPYRTTFKSHAARILDNTIIEDTVHITMINKSLILGSTKISGKAKVIFERGEENYFSFGLSDVKIYDTAKLVLSHSIHSSRFSGDTRVINPVGEISNIFLTHGEYSNFSQGSFNILEVVSEIEKQPAGVMSERNGSKIGITSKRPDEDTSKVSERSGLSPNDEFSHPRIQEISDSFDAYQNDIVKLIRYPAMSDMKNSDTLNFVMALKKTKRRVTTSNHSTSETEDLIDDLEKLFIIAESSAQKLVDTSIAPQDRAKLKTVKQLLAITHDENANEHEKKISCERVLKELKGFLPISDALVNNLRISAGLKELER